MKSATAMKTNAAPRAKTVTVLGSTGTIGQNTLKIIEWQNGAMELNAITAGNNVALLIEQAKRFKPKLAVIAESSHYAELKNALTGTGVEVACGSQAVIDAAALDADIVMSAIVGAAGLKPTLAAISKGTTVALANKECLVCAGELVMKEVAKHKATLLPVDSEHSAIFQLLDEHNIAHVATVTITASGGPFRGWSMEQMRGVTPAQAVKHPNWTMGAKISVDSATLMNKGLELIEAFHLFPLAAEQLQVLVHPQSIIHCLVQMVDGSVLAQLSMPDMCTPIAYAMAWPQRIAAPVKKLDLAAIGKLEFSAPDADAFPAVRIAREVLNSGGSAATVLNAANEVAVNRFLKNEIGFLDIVAIVEKTLGRLAACPLNTIDDVFDCDAQARRFAEKL